LFNLDLIVFRMETVNAQRVIRHVHLISFQRPQTFRSISWIFEHFGMVFCVYSLHSSIQQDNLGYMIKICFQYFQFFLCFPPNAELRGGG